MVSVAEGRTHGVRRRRRDAGKGIVELGLKRAGRVVASALGEPQGIVERTRWLFAMWRSPPSSWSFCRPSCSRRAPLVGSVGAAAVLWTSWVFGYRRIVADADGSGGRRRLGRACRVRTGERRGDRRDLRCRPVPIAVRLLPAQLRAGRAVLRGPECGRGGVADAAGARGDDRIQLVADIGPGDSAGGRDREPPRRVGAGPRERRAARGCAGLDGLRLLGTTDAAAIRGIAWAASDRISEVRRAWS